MLEAPPSQYCTTLSKSSELSDVFVGLLQAPLSPTQALAVLYTLYNQTILLIPHSRFDVYWVDLRREPKNQNPVIFDCIWWCICCCTPINFILNKQEAVLVFTCSI